MRGNKQAVAIWLGKADGDWQALQILQRDDRLWGVVCFHAQQAVEKWLKAFLVYHAVVPPWIHDLAILLSECAKADPSLRSFKPDCRAITRYAVKVRYPDEEDPSPGQGRAVVRRAGRVRKAILARIKMEPQEKAQSKAKSKR